MSLANLVNPIDLREALINIKFTRDEFPLPDDVQERVDANFAVFSQRQEEKTGKRPTKGEIAVLRSYKILPNGVEGESGVSTFDRVLYFARTQIPAGDYEIGRQSGFPLASWALPLSSNNKLIFVRKRGAEGAYAGDPFSGFGALVSIEKDTRESSLDVQSFLERSVGKEVGSEAWEMFQSASFTGLNDHDENSSTVNNGYDLVLETRFDASAEKIIRVFSSNPQFTSSREAVYVEADPDLLRKFVEKYPTTHSGIIGIFSYIGSRFGEDEARNQLRRYQESGKQIQGGIKFRKF